MWLKGKHFIIVFSQSSFATLLHWHKKFHNKPKVNKSSKCIIQGNLPSIPCGELLGVQHNKYIASITIIVWENKWTQYSSQEFSIIVLNLNTPKIVHKLLQWWIIGNKTTLLHVFLFKFVVKFYELRFCWS